MDNMQNMGMCKCGHHKVVPVLIILFGLIFLLEALGFVRMDFAMIAWPILVIAGGLIKFAEKAKMCKCC